MALISLSAAADRTMLPAWRTISQIWSSNWSDIGNPPFAFGSPSDFDIYNKYNNGKKGEQGDKAALYVGRMAVMWSGISDGYLLWLMNE